MARFKRFTFICDAEERRILADLAKHLQRSQSDSVRWLILNAAAELHIPSAPTAPLLQTETELQPHA